ncbi:hypothetical protein [Rhodobacter sp. NSM]|uniref:hypothetical protein n=1 Tax=Rhodobacter sp. NSM TaxID=3457501 RepID=UPI003FD1FB12
MRMTLSMILLVATTAADEARANVAIAFCQDGDADIAVLSTHGDSGWITGGTKGISGWHRIDAGGCFNDRIFTYQSREYVFAGMTSTGRIVPLELSFRNMGPVSHRLQTGQICVPQTISSFGKTSLRSGAERPPCQPGEVSFAASLFVLAGNEFENFRIHLDMDQGEIDALLPADEGAPPAPIRPAPSPPVPDKQACGLLCRLALGALILGQGGTSGAASDPGPPVSGQDPAPDGDVRSGRLPAAPIVPPSEPALDPRTRALIDSVKDAMQSPDLTTASDVSGKLDLLRKGWTTLPLDLRPLMPRDVRDGVLRNAYPEYRTVRLAFMDQDDFLIRAFIYDQDRSTNVFVAVDGASGSSWWLNGDSANLYAYLKADPPEVTTEEQALHLFWAYMFFIRGSESENVFAIVETINDATYPSEMREQHPALTAEVAERLKPARCTRLNEKWRCTGNIYHRNAISEAMLEFIPGNPPEMVSDTLLFENLPVSVRMAID